MADEKKWQIELTAGPKAAPSETTIRDPQVHDVRVDGDARPRARLGPYAILKEIGRGGQGVVYLAEDTRLGRQVAVKVLSTLFAADSWSRLRFEREASATARLDHPGICTVYEAGTIDETPFIAMRLVGGESLSSRIAGAWVDRPKKTTTSTFGAGGRHRREALFADVEIVEKVARALHVAHEAGLVHRDMKPGNVMVEPSGQPVVLDFGLARDAQNADLLLTGTGTFLGTPPYMSPEQIDSTGAVDRRTDVWALGVILYEVGTGTRPFDAPTIEGLLRAIRTAEPPDPRKLNAAVTPELAAVILHALEKDRGHRYQDAAALADDLGRVRRLEPVHARAPSAWMRCRRWAQRNPVVAASLAVVLFGLSVALAISLAGLDAAREALARESAALLEARNQRNRAEDLSSFMLVDLKRKLEDVGRLDILGKVARKADDYFASRPLDFDQETESLQRALAVRNVGDVLKSEGDIVAAIKHYEDACRIEEELWRRNPNSAAALHDLAASVHARSAAAMARGDRAEGLALAEQALDLKKKLVALAPDDCEAKTMLVTGIGMVGNALKFADRSADALPVYRDAIARSKTLCDEDTSPMRRRELAIMLQNFGDARRLTGDLDGALESRTEGLGVYESLAKDEPANRDVQEQIATTHHGIASIFSQKNDHPKAIEHSKQAVAILRRLLEEDPTNSRRLFQISVALHQLSLNQSRSGKSGDALASLDESVAARKRLVALDPKNRSWRADLADVARAAAVLLGSMGRLDEALARIDESIALFGTLASEAPDDAFVRGKLADTLSRAGEIEGELGRPADALRRYLASVEAAEAAYATPKPTFRAVRELALRAGFAADTLRLLGETQKAIAMQARSVAMRKRELEMAADTQKEDASTSLANALVHLGEWQVEAGDAKAAIEPLAEAESAMKGLRGEAKDAAIAGALETQAQVALAEAFAATSDLDAADSAAERAAATLDALVAAKGGSGDAPSLRARLDMVRRLRAALGPGGPQEPEDHEALAIHLAVTGRSREAVDHFAPGLEAPPASEKIRLRSLRLAAAAAARALESATPETRARVESLGLAWVDAAARIQAAALGARESLHAAQKAQGSIADDLRDELWELRCWFGALQVLDPALAPLRKLPGFAAAAADRR